MLHECDTHIHIDKEPTTMVRTIRVGKKNRFGSDAEKALFNLDEKGRVIWLNGNDTSGNVEKSNVAVLNEFDFFTIDTDDLYETQNSIQI
jgi:predicted ATP-dependent serine protease